MEVTLVSFPVPYVSTPMSLADVSGADISVVDEPIVTTPFAPLDEYQCEVCFNVPQCEPEIPGVCLGDSIRFENVSEIGLKCYQEWVLTGPGIDSPLVFSADIQGQLDWLPSAPGEYTAILRSTCPEVPAADTAFVFVSQIEPQISSPITVDSESPATVGWMAGFKERPKGAMSPAGSINGTGARLPGNPFRRIPCRPASSWAL